MPRTLPLLQLTRVLLISLIFFHPIRLATAAGMVPETSVIIVLEEQREATIRVKNTDAHAALLLTSIITRPEETDVLLVATPPVARLEADETQLVRFLLQTQTPLKVQRLHRVVFEGIQPKNPDPGVRLNMNVRQNLPVIIHPKGLALERQPWTLMRWSLRGGQLHVENPSPYVVRLAQAVELLPSGGRITLAHSYILPGQQFSFPIDTKQAAAIQEVRISPATVYGYTVATFVAPVGNEL